MLDIIVKSSCIAAETCKAVEVALFVLIELRFELSISIVHSDLNRRIKHLNRSTMEDFDRRFLKRRQIFLKIYFPLFVREVTEAGTLARASLLSFLY